MRRLRRQVCDVAPGARSASSEGMGVEIAMIPEEAEPIGGFASVSISEPLLQGGILVSVIGYVFVFVLQSWLALLGLAFFLPQTVFVLLLQSAVNRRARIRAKHTVSGSVAEGSPGGAPRPLGAAIQRIFALNMGIYRFKYSMNLLMNLMHHFSVAVALCVGGWMHRGGHGRRRRKRTGQAQRPVGRSRELGPRAVGGRGEISPVRRRLGLACRSPARLATWRTPCATPH